MTSPLNQDQYVHWVENDQPQSMLWHSESGAPAPKRVQIADDTLNADTAYKLACEGVALLWRGDFQNGRQLLQAIARRIEINKLKKSAKKRKDNHTPRESFNLYRLAQSQRARTLAMVLIPFEADYHIPLRRSPNVTQACEEAYGTFKAPFIASLRELLGVVGAHEWRKNGVEIAALGKKIHPHYGVFSPVRGEYLKLIANAHLPTTELAFDIGTGTGVIAAILAQRGVQKIIATDQDQRAITCAKENIAALEISHQVQLCQTDLFPEGRAPLIICNPPWLPARPNSPIEYAVYDPESRMLKGFLSQVAQHLEPHGEAWLIMSNLAELTQLRAESDLTTWISDGGLAVIEKHDIRPEHPKAFDSTDPLFAARSAEVTSLWRLRLE